MLPPDFCGILKHQLYDNKPETRLTFHRNFSSHETLKGLVVNWSVNSDGPDGHGRWTWQICTVNHQVLKVNESDFDLLSRHLEKTKK